MSHVAREAATVASGTLATLTGEREYAKLESIQADFVDFVRANESEHKWETWQDAWSSFWLGRTVAA